MQEPEATVSPEIDKIELYLYGKDASENVTDFDFSQPIFRESLEKYLPFLIIPYSLLTISGCILNCAVIVLIFRKRLYFDETHGFIANLSFCHVIQSVFVLPLTLMIIIVQNWIFGQFLCFFTPMLQDTPIHVQVSTLILIAWDRLRWLSDPLKTRLPSFICSCGTWFAGIIITLPYPIYTTYIDLGLYESRYAGVGICAVKILDDKLDEYTRTLFILMFCVPAVLLSFLNIRIAKELKTPEGPLAIMMYEARSDLRRKQKLAVMSRPTFERTLSSASNTSKSKCRTNSTVSYDLYDAEMDGMLEKRLQKYLSAIFLSSFLCLIPLMILRLARMNVPETYENTMHYDFCFLFFIFIANLPTVVDPLIYLSLLLERHTKSSFWRIFLLTSKHESENIENISDSSKAYDRRSFVTDVSDNKRTDNKNTCHNKKSDRRKNREMLTPIKDSTLTSPHNMEPESPQRTKPLMFNTPKYSCENIRPPKLLRQYEESSSNASNVTYFNDNESTLKAPRKLSRSTHFEHRKLPNVSLSADNFEIESQYSSLKNSTSTIAHDIEVIELLERKRSMDLKEMLLADNYRRESNESRRQLIASSPSNFIELSPTLNVMGPIGNKSYRDPSEYDTNYYQRKKSLDTGFTSALYDDSKKDNVLLRKNSNDSRYSDIRSKSRASKYDEDRDEAESFFHKSFNSSITKNDCDIFSMNNSNKKTITPNDFASEF